MKKIISVLVLLQSFIGFSQAKTKEERQAILDAKKKGITLIDSSSILKSYKYHKNILMAKDGIENASQVIILDSLSAKEIYSRINKYIQKTYANPDKVSKGNVENEYISFNGIKNNCITRRILLTNYYYSLEYYFSIDIKDGKMKITLTKAEESCNESKGFMNRINCFFPNTYNLFNNNGEPRSATSSIVFGFDKNINEIVNEIIINIKGTKKSDW